MKHLFPLIFLFLILTTACGDKAKDEPTPPPAPQQPVSRTVLVYMVADNTLGNSGLDASDIREMTEAAANGKLNGGRLLVYRNFPPTQLGNTPYMLEITAEGQKIVKDYPDEPSIYSVDPQRITEVMADMKELAPAEEYGLILWSHANGWLGSPGGKYDDRYRAFGDDRGHHITLPTLASTLQGEKFSFIYFDCCLMGNIETIYELRGLTSLMGAAPTELGVEGMPYDETLGYFFMSEPDIAGAARTTWEWYSSRGRECQLAAYDLTALPRFVDATRNVLAKAPNRYPDGISNLQPYVKPGEYCHSYDMADYYELLGADPEWRDALGQLVTWKAATPEGIGFLRIDTDRYCGLGTHAPRPPQDLTYRHYDDLAWCKDVIKIGNWELGIGN